MKEYNYSADDIKRILEEKKKQYADRPLKKMTEEELRQRTIECFDYEPDLSQVKNKWWLEDQI